MQNNRKERVSPVYYSPTEDLLSAITHGIGALLGILALCQLLLAAKGPLSTVAAAIYGASLIISFTVSTLSHSLTPREAKKVFRILDHSTIFLLIAGTYTPVTLLSLKGALGWTVFGVQWGIAALGITLTAVALNRFKGISTFLYISMGWAIILVGYPLLHRIEPAGLIYLLGGGIFYTIGVFFYRLKKPYMHLLWHFFSLCGALLQYVAVCRFILPL